MEEYKGIYYGDETEQNYYEGGAHFKYIKLYKILEKLAKERNAKEKKQNILYVHKSNNLNKSNNKNINKKTRNIIDNIDINKIQYNTINNNYNNINYNFQNNYNIFLSINKDNNKNKIENNLSMINPKKEIDSRNKESIKAFKGRPNTILKESLQKILYTKKNKILSSSMENKNKTRIRVKFPLNLKKCIQEFNPSNIQKINNYSSNKSYRINCDIDINNSSKRIKVYKNNDIKSLLININNNTTNIANNDIQQNIQNISYSNAKKISMKTDRIQPIWGKKKEKKIFEKINQIKDNNNIFNKMNFSNSIKISRRTHNIINKRIIGKKNIDNKNSKDSKDKSIIVSEIFNKTKIDKAKINLFLNKSNKKKTIKKDFNFLNNTTLLEKTNYKNNQFSNIRKDLNNEKKILTEKKLLNLKKIDKYNLIKSNNNQLSFNKFNNKSRNYNDKNTSFQVKKIFNQNNSINNKNNDSEIFKNFFKTMEDMNNTYTNNTNKKVYINLNDSTNKSRINKNRNYNYICNSNKKRINNNKNLMNNNLNSNEVVKKQFEIKPYIQIKPYNGSKKKINLNSSIKVKKKVHTHNIPKKNNDKIDIKFNNIKI